MAKAQVPVTSKPQFSYTISALRDEALRGTEDLTAAAQLRGQQPHLGWQTSLPPLTWATKSQQCLPIVSAQVTTAQHFVLSKQKHRTSYADLAFVCGRVCTLGVVSGAPPWPRDATGSPLQTWRWQESVSLMVPLATIQPNFTSGYTAALIFIIWDGIPSSFYPQQCCCFSFSQIHNWVFLLSDGIP